MHQGYKECLHEKYAKIEGKCHGKLLKKKQKVQQVKNIVGYIHCPWNSRNTLCMNLLSVLLFFNMYICILFCVVGFIPLSLFMFFFVLEELLFCFLELFRENISLLKTTNLPYHC